MVTASRTANDPDPWAIISMMRHGKSRICVLDAADGPDSSPKSVTGNPASGNDEWSEVRVPARELSIGFASSLGS
jgi:hypothetical protein